MYLFIDQWPLVLLAEFVPQRKLIEEPWSKSYHVIYVSVEGKCPAMSITARYNIAKHFQERDRLLLDLVWYIW